MKLMIEPHIVIARSITSIHATKPHAQKPKSGNSDEL